MFGWLKKKAAQQSLFNVEINTRTLIFIANEIDKVIMASGSTNESLRRKAVNAQRSLLTDINLALANDASIDDVLARVEVAKSKEKPSEGAKLAVAHVLTYATHAPKVFAFLKSKGLNEAEADSVFSIALKNFGVEGIASIYQLSDEKIAAMRGQV